jgi:hypothetical protein
MAECRTITSAEIQAFIRERVRDLRFNYETDRWEIELGISTESKPFIIPKNSNPEEGYETKWIAGKPVYPIFKGKPLKQFIREKLSFSDLD